MNPKYDRETPRMFGPHDIVQMKAARMTGQNYLQRERKPFPCHHLRPFLHDNPILAWFVETQERPSERPQRGR